MQCIINSMYIHKHMYLKELITIVTITSTIHKITIITECISLSGGNLSKWNEIFLNEMKSITRYKNVAAKN